LFLTTSIAGRAEKEREILYDGEVRLMEGRQGRVLDITSCYVYELHFKNVPASDALLVEADFIVELAYEYQDAAGARLQHIRKLSCHQRLHPDIRGLAARPSEAEQLYVTPVVRGMAYRYMITGDGFGIRLIISASIEYLATFGYYANIHACGKEQPEPGPIECINWQTVFDNIGFEDARACLENLIRLIKTRALFGNQNKTPYPSGEGMIPDMAGENRRLREQNQSLEERIRSSRMTIAQLQSQLREREEIISKLLVLLDKNRKD